MDKKLTNNLQIRGSREATPFFCWGAIFVLILVGKQNFGAVLIKNRSASKKMGGFYEKMRGKKILAPAAKKEKIWGANFNSAPAGSKIIPRGFFNLAFR